MEALKPGIPGEVSEGRQSDGRFVVQVRIRFSWSEAPIKVRATSSEKSDRKARKEALERLELNIQKKRRERSLSSGVRAFDTMTLLWELWQERAQTEPEAFGLRPGTVQDYEDAWRAHLGPELGDMVIADVNTQVLAKTLRTVSIRRRKLRGGNLSPTPELHTGIARTCYATLAKVFDYAVELSIVDRSPVVGQILPSGKGQVRSKLKIDASLLHRLRELLDEYDTSIRTTYPWMEPVPLRALAEVQLYGSARIGEVLSLDTSDIDPDDLIQSDEDVDGGVDIFFRSKQERAGGVANPTTGRRSGSTLIRSPLPKGGEDAWTIKTIPGWVYRRYIEPRITGPRQQPPVYIFRTAAGTQHEKANVARSWRKALEGSELMDPDTRLPLVTPHDLRKASAQVLADTLGGAAAQAALAHKSIRTTEGTYITKAVPRVNFAETLDSILHERGNTDDVF